MSKPIRVLTLVTYKIFPAIMGGQKGVALFYDAFCKLVSLYCVTSIANVNHNVNYTVDTYLSNSPLRYINPFLFFNIKRRIRAFNIDYVLFEHPYFAWLIVLLSTFSNVKIIVHSHNIESERFKTLGKWWWKILWHYEKMAYQNANLIWFKTIEDKDYAINQYGISIERAVVIPYGVELNALPTKNVIDDAKDYVLKKHQLNIDDKIILFNGTLNYGPNLNALDAILNHINPQLLASRQQYKIIICGKNLPVTYNNLDVYAAQNIIYAGFVDDIDVYFKACDIFINPVLDGGGIKTKLVEALGFGKLAISTTNGAFGVDANVTGHRLSIVPDNDWNAFTIAILLRLNQQNFDDNKLFYEHYAWDNIAHKAFNSLTR